MSKSVLKKACALSLTMGLVLSFTAGCGSTTGQADGTDAQGQSSNNTAGTTEAKGSGEKIVIRFMTREAGSDAVVPIHQEEFARFEAEHPNVVIQNESIAEENAYNNKIKTSIATGTQPELFNYPAVIGAVGWAKNGVIMNIDSLIEDKEWSGGFIDGAFENWNFEKYGVSGHYAIPYSFSPEVILYNTEIFQKAGITKTPETMSELFDVIEKLKAAGVVPMSMGNKDVWRGGHLHNNILYRYIGVDKAKDLGLRTKKWTDADVVGSLQAIKDLVTAGAFEEGFGGLDYNTEKTLFLNGEYAMSCNGSWIIADYMSSDSPNKDKISFFPFPYFDDKPELKGDSVLYSSPIFLSNATEGEKRNMQMEFAKFLYGKECSQERMDKIGRFSSRKDVTAPENSSKLLKDVIAYMGTITNPGGDYFEYEADPAMLDVCRNAIAGMMLGDSAEKAAQTIQGSLDAYDNSLKK